MIAQPAFTAIELLADLRIGTAREAVAAALHEVPGLHGAPRGIAWPAWLWSEHHALASTLAGALQRFGGALLAAPTGSGKSYVALAVAMQCRTDLARRLSQAPDARTDRDGGITQACAASMPVRQTLQDRPAAPHAGMSDAAADAVIVCPAALRRQWTLLGKALGLSLPVRTHESLSRAPSALPDAPLVIVDESHRFREPGTRKHAALADLLVGRRTVLCTATPLVNRLDDLVHQLALILPDDALARDGLPSLRRRILGGTGHVALDRIVIAPPRSDAGGPAVRRREVRAAMTPTLGEAIASLEALAWSRDASVARLLRGVLWRALASSPAAALAVLRRHARLLAHARDAAAAGRTVTRGDVVAWTAQLDDQLLLWAVLPDSTADADLVLDDAARLGAAADALRACEAHGIVATVHELVVHDDRPTIIFAALRATAASLVRALGPRTAWCTGDAAGIGHTRLPREAVLGHFRRDEVLPGAPHLLVATDVAAEGLDLPRLRRVIHADLPWTPARLAQREGRARRAASRADVVDVIVCLPAAALAERAGVEAQLAVKRLLGARSGLDALRDAWQWRARLQRRCTGATPLDGIFARQRIRAGIARAFVALEDESGARSLLLVHEDGTVIEDPAVLAATLEQVLTPDARCEHQADDAHATSPSEPCDRCDADCAASHADTDAMATCDHLLAAVRDELRRRLALRHGGDWLLDARSAGAVPLVLRLQALATSAARERRVGRLQRLDGWLRWAARGHATGERRLATTLASLSDDALARHVDRETAPPSPAVAPPSPPRLRLRALLLLHP